MDVRDVDDENERDPAPRGQGTSKAQARRERGEDEREDSRTTERGDVGARAPEPRGAGGRYRGEPPWMAAPITIARPMNTLPMTMPRAVF